MNVMWLDHSMLFRAENAEEKAALAVVYEALRSEPEKNTTGEAEGAG